MKIIVISYFTPYKENCRGISALIYHLIKFRPSDVDLKLYSFNCNHLSTCQINEVIKDLNIPLKLIPEHINHPDYKPNIWSKILDRILNRERNMLTIPDSIVTEIRQISPDYVWLYPYYFYHFPYLMPDCKFVMTGCDSNALLYKRMLSDIVIFKNCWKYLKVVVSFRNALKTERKFPKTNTFIHFVGKADCEYYNRKTGHGNGIYTPHPHYTIQNKNISFNSPKLKVLLAGANDFYMKKEASRLLNCLLRNADTLYDKIDITFLGKGWGDYKNLLSACKYCCGCKEWVDDYISEIVKHDIQLVPLSVGTGTKGKVLDAMANGLLVIGTSCAVENIDEMGKGCIVYKDVDYVVKILKDAFVNRKKYETLAEDGRAIVLCQHNPRKCSEDFFNIFC